MLFCTAPTRAFIFGISAAAALALGVTRAGAEALLLVEADTGKVLHAENATHPWYPASVTKLMTTYVTLRAVKDRRITLDKLLTVSENAVAQAPTKMGFKVGTQVTVDNALKMLMVKSANDMAVALAEGVSGSIENFANDMNRAAQRLGMTQTTYVNPNGLPADGQVTSARDLAILARTMMRELPEYDFYWHIPAIKFGKRVMRNYNSLIDRYPGADGMKTGFICASGFNLVASATRGNKRLIAVVLGARSGAQRAEKAARLLEQGFTSSGLSWLMPMLGSVDALQPVAAAPPNLRDEMCGKHRRRPASDNSEDEEEANHTSDPGAMIASMLPLFNLKNMKPGPLLGPRVASAAPISVFVGPGAAPKITPVDVAATARGKKTRTAVAAAAPGLPPPPEAPAVAGPAPEPAFGPATLDLGKILPSGIFTQSESSALALTNPAEEAAGPVVHLDPDVPMPRPRPKFDSAIP